LPRAGARAMNNIYPMLTGIVVGKLLIVLSQTTDPDVAQFCAIGLAVNLVGLVAWILYQVYSPNKEA